MRGWPADCTIVCLYVDAFGWQVGLAPPLAMKEISLDQLSAGRFAELVRTRFNILAEPGVEVILELIAVTMPRSNAQESMSPGDPRTESFSLLFAGPADRPLGQGMYRFAHEHLGWFDLFIVPVSAEPGARQYEAVFNRHIAARTPVSPG